MVALRNEVGVRVDVSEETAARLGPEWVPVDADKSDRPRRSKPTAQTEK